MIVVLLLPRSVMLVAASVRTEALQFSVRNSILEIKFPRARLGDHGPCLNDVTVEPEPRATVNYTRPIGQAMVIIVGGASVWRARGIRQRRVRSRDAVTFRLDPADARCRAPEHLRVPIDGTLALGTIDLPVLAGDLKIYGRAIGTLFGGVVPLGWLAPITGARAGSLYPADVIALPPGSLLARTLLGPESPADAEWTGFTDVDLSEAGASERGMVIEASANASTIDMLLPAPAIVDVAGDMKPTSDPEVISLSLGARLVGDPNLRWFFAFVSFLLVVIGVQAQVASVPPPEQSR